MPIRKRPIEDDVFKERVESRWRDPKIVFTLLLILTILVAWLVYSLLKPEGIPADYGRAKKVTMRHLFTFPEEGGRYGLQGPAAVAAMGGRYYVSEPSPARISVWDRFGSYLYHFLVTASDSAGAPVNAAPTGVAVLPGRIFVSELVSGDILEYDIGGQLIGRLTVSYSAAGKGKKNPAASDAGRLVGLNSWSDPQSTSQMLFATDVGFQRIMRLTEKGRVLMMTGMPGSGDGQLKFPNSIAADHFQKMFVGDSANARVSVFTPEGEFVDSFPAKRISPPFPKAKMSLPKGIGVDSNGSVHVSDGLSQKVLVFNGQGDYLGSYGDMGSGPEQVEFPAGIAVDGDRIAIADSGNDRITVWEYGY